MKQTSSRRPPSKARVLATLAALTLVATIVLAAILANAVRPDSRPPAEEHGIAFGTVRWSELTPPGSALLGPRTAVPSNETAVVGGQLWVGTNLPDDEIKAFYTTLFARHGWVPDGSLVRMRYTDETDTCTWHNTDLTVRVAVLDMRDWLGWTASDREWRVVYTIQVLEGASQKERPHACLIYR